MSKSSLELAVEAAEKINIQLKGQFKLPPSNLRKKLSIPLKPKPTQTFLGGHLISPSAKKVPSSEQKPIYFTPERLPEGIELLNNSSYVGFRCTYCDVKLTSEAILRRHIEGTEHLKKSLLKLNAGKKDLKHQQTVVTTPKSTVDEDSTDISKPIIDKKDQGQQKTITTPPKPTLYYYLADTSEPVIGLDFVVETQFPDAEPTFYCKLCEIQCGTNEIKEHIVGIRHCLMYLQMEEAKKIEEIRNQYKKKSERNQEILKFAARVEKERGRGTVKLILPQMLNKESSKKAERQLDKESKDSCGSLKRAIEEPSSSSRKKPAFSNDSSDFKSYDNTKYYSSSHHSDIKQSDEFQDKQLQKNDKKRNRWGGFADSNTTSSVQVLSNVVDFSAITTNNVPSLKESHPSLTANVARKTSLPKLQPKKPLYKPPRSFLLPSDIIKSLNQTQKKLPQISTLQAVPYLQTLPQTISPSKKTSPTVPQKRTRTTSAKDSKPVSLQCQLKNTAKLTSQHQTNLNLFRKEVVLETSHHQFSPKLEIAPSTSNKPRSDSVRTKTKLFESQYNEKSDSERNAIFSTPSQHKLKENITLPTSGPVNPARSTSEHVMTGLLNLSEVKGSSNTEIEALKHLTSFVITDDDDAGNVMEVITSLTQAYLHYKTRALTRPVRELLFQSLKDGSEGLQIVLGHYGVNNMEPLGSFSDINNDITRCASNLLRQFSSNWVEEPDESLPYKPDDSLDEDNFPPNRETTTEESEMLPFSQNEDSNIDNVDSSMTDNTSEFKQPFPHNWKENKNNASIKSSRSGSFNNWNGFPLRSDSSNIFDR